MKTKTSILFTIMLSLVNIGIVVPVSAQSNLPGRLVGTVTSTKGTTIYLSENFNMGVSSVAAYVKQDGKYVPADVFKVRKHTRSVIASVKYDTWISTCPESGFFHFNKADNTLYIPLIDDYLSGGDKYIVYRFDGEHFVYKGKDAGYWLHQSIRNFDILYALGKTKDFIVRVDRMPDGSFRYASWNANKTMKDKPNIILYNEVPYVDGCLNFYNGDFIYTFDNDKSELRVYEGSKLIKQQKMEVLYW